MYLPLEILRKIISAADSTYSKLGDVMALRLVNRDFDKEVLSNVFLDKKPIRRNRLFHPLSGKSLAAVPSKLRERYLYHRIKHHKQEPTVFTTIFIPVIQREMARLGLDESDKEAQDALLGEWLRVPMDSKVETYVTHESEDLVNCQANLKKEFQRQFSEIADFEQWFEAKIVHEWTVGRLRLAIMRNEERTVSQILQEPRTDFFFYFRDCYCFSTSFLHFAVLWSSCSVLRTVLRHHRVDAYFPLHVCLRFASDRKDSREECAAELISTYGSGDTRYEGERNEVVYGLGIERNLILTIGRESSWIVEQILHWLLNQPPSPDKQRMMHLSIRHAIKFGREKAVEDLAPHVDLAQVDDDEEPEPPLPLQRAVRATNRKNRVLRCLLDHGADPNAVGDVNSGLPPVFMAVEVKQMSFAQLLLERGAKPTCEGSKSPLLHHARVHGVEAQVKGLLRDTGWEKEVLAWEALVALGD